MNDIDLEIETLQNQIVRLKDRVRRLKSRKRQTDDPRLSRLILHVIENPGCDRSSIEEVFPSLSYSDFTNLLTKARRQGSIANRGSRSHPAWYWQDREERRQ